MIMNYVVRIQWWLWVRIVSYPHAIWFVDNYVRELRLTHQWRSSQFSEDWELICCWKLPFLEEIRILHRFEGFHGCNFSTYDVFVSVVFWFGKVRRNCHWDSRLHRLWTKTWLLLSFSLTFFSSLPTMGSMFSTMYVNLRKILPKSSLIFILSIA